MEILTHFSGVAACHIGGVTLHAFAGFGLKNKAQIVEKWRNTKILIIDEISMIDSEMFDEVLILNEYIIVLA